MEHSIGQWAPTAGRRSAPEARRLKPGDRVPTARIAGSFASSLEAVAPNRPRRLSNARIAGLHARLAATLIGTGPLASASSPMVAKRDTCGLPYAVMPSSCGEVPLVHKRNGALAIAPAGQGCVAGAPGGCAVARRGPALRCGSRCCNCRSARQTAAVGVVATNGFVGTLPAAGCDKDGPAIAGPVSIGVWYTAELPARSEMVARIATGRAPAGGCQRAWSKPELARRRRICNVTGCHGAAGSVCASTFNVAGSRFTSVARHWISIAPFSAGRARSSSIRGMRRVDDHAQLRLIRPFGPGAAAVVERANREPIFAVAFGAIVERLDVRLGLADLLPARAAILRHKQRHRPVPRPARRPSPTGTESETDAASSRSARAVRATGQLAPAGRWRELRTGADRSRPARSRSRATNAAVATTTSATGAA